MNILLKMFFNIVFSSDISNFKNFWMISYIPLLIILTIGVKKRSRICIILITLFYILIQLFNFLKNEKFNPLNIFSIIIIYFLIAGIVATFKYHFGNIKWYEKKDKELKKRFIIGVIACFIISLLLISHFIIINYIGYDNIF